MNEDTLTPAESAAIRAVLSATEADPPIDEAMRRNLLEKGFLRADGETLVATLAGHRRYLASIASRFDD